jgi:hypothetical protein
MSSNFMFLRMHLSKIITSDGQRLNGVRRVSLFFHMDHSPFDVFKNSTVFAIWTAALCPPLHIVFPLSLFTKYVPAYHVSAVLSGVQRYKNTPICNDMVRPILLSNPQSCIIICIKGYVPTWMDSSLVSRSSHIHTKETYDIAMFP